MGRWLNSLKEYDIVLANRWKGKGQRAKGKNRFKIENKK